MDTSRILVFNLPDNRQDINTISSQNIMEGLSIMDKVSIREYYPGIFLSRDSKTMRLLLREILKNSPIALSTVEKCPRIVRKLQPEKSDPLASKVFSEAVFGCSSLMRQERLLLGIVVTATGGQISLLPGWNTFILTRDAIISD
jgi:hypothetical protein